MHLLTLSQFIKGLDNLGYTLEAPVSTPKERDTLFSKLYPFFKRNGLSILVGFIKFVIPAYGKEYVKELGLAFGFPDEISKEEFESRLNEVYKQIVESFKP
jgi:hypothetical protein